MTTAQLKQAAEECVRVGRIFVILLALVAVVLGWSAGSQEQCSYRSSFDGFPTLDCEDEFDGITFVTVGLGVFIGGLFTVYPTLALGKLTRGVAELMERSTPTTPGAPPPS